MANDRLLIKCDTCGAWKMLMKHFPGALETRENNILAWLDAHGSCHPRLYDGDLGGSPGFSLHTEDALDDAETLSPGKQNALPPSDQLSGPRPAN